MVFVVRLVKIAATLVLALLAISFLIALFRPEVGVVEKTVLAVLLALTPVAAAKVSSLSVRQR